MSQKFFLETKSDTTLCVFLVMVFLCGLSYAGSVDIPAEKFNSFRKITFDPKRFPSSMIADRAPDLAIAIGLALRSAEE